MSVVLVEVLNLTFPTIPSATGSHKRHGRQLVRPKAAESVNGTTAPGASS